MGYWKSVLWATLVCSLVGLSVAQTSTGARKDTRPSIVVNFSPKGGITDADVAAIGAAEQEVLVHSYSFTSKPICEALLAAKKRGVHVRMLIDEQASQAQYCLVGTLLDAKCAVRTADCHGIAHNKVMLIDGQTIITGSFNWSSQAEHVNQENQLILRGYANLMQSYQDNWDRCWRDGTPYTPK